MQRAKWGILIVAGLIVIIIDQLAKYWVIENLILGESRPLGPLSPFLQITRSYNTGAAFGLLSSNGNIHLIFSSIIVVGLLIYFGRQKKTHYAHAIGIGMILGGALGNIIDRIRLDHVVDFFHVSIPNLISNISNFADHAIIIGVLILLISTWREERHIEALKPDAD
ncbi:lipoprotein signal peptidase LspA [Anaerolineales bacterium]